MVADQTPTRKYRPPKWHQFPLKYEGTIPEDDEWVRTLKDCENSGRVQTALKNTAKHLSSHRPDQPFAQPRISPHMQQWRRMVGLLKVLPIVEWLTPQLLRYDIEKAVIFFHHTLVGSLFQEYLAPFKARMIFGGTAEVRRQRKINKFTSGTAERVLLCQDNIARQAIDLSVARHLIFAEMDFVPENNAQAAMRIQGPLQGEQTHIYVPILEGSSDEIITEICARKSRMCGQILE